MVDESTRGALDVTWLARSGLCAATILGGVGFACALLPSELLGPAVADAGNVLTTIAVPVVMFAIGSWWPRWVGAALALWISVGWELDQGYANPFIVVLIVGPWIVGAMIRDRRLLADRLLATGRALERESELLAAESVRLERAHIARELHDVVAHCVSVMVVQAYAGERLATRDGDAADDAFAHIADVAEQAEHEIGHLVQLLSGDSAQPAERGLAARVGELVAGAVATGLSVNLRVHGETETLPEPTSQTAYRVIQEAVTNALKHAPGVEINVAVDCSGEDVRICVRNPLVFPDRESAALQEAGGGHGLSGMTERVAVLGGQVWAGVVGDDTWEVAARLPKSARENRRDRAEPTSATQFEA